MKTYKVHEIFYSLQGEGTWTGTPMTFIRFYGCNLSCTFCDTPQQPGDFKEMTAVSIWREVDRISPPNVDVCITGGEPLLQVDMEFLEANDGRRMLHLETNGTYLITEDMRDNFVWIAVSPKDKPVILNQRYIDEVRWPYSPEKEEEILQSELKGQMFVSPINFTDGINADNLTAAIEFCKKYPQFTLSIQLHKLIEFK